MPLRVASAMSLRSSSPDFGANNRANTAPIPAPTRKYVSRVEILSPYSRSIPIKHPLVRGESLFEDRRSLQKLSRMMAGATISKGRLCAQGKCLKDSAEYAEHLCG